MREDDLHTYGLELARQALVEPSATPDDERRWPEELAGAEGGVAEGVDAQGARGGRQGHPSDRALPEVHRRAGAAHGRDDRRPARVAARGGPIVRRAGEHGAVGVDDGRLTRLARGAPAAALRSGGEEQPLDDGLAGRDLADVRGPVPGVAPREGLHLPSHVRPREPHDAHPAHRIEQALGALEGLRLGDDDAPEAAGVGRLQRPRAHHARAQRRREDRVRPVYRAPVRAHGPDGRGLAVVRRVAVVLTVRLRDAVVVPQGCHLQRAIRGP
mmetsp:Transcript_121554/g.388925  ORF Transcript_121554/g.388925 Transcript_121554/m.388925 type:complete len:271 (-) Transcript_121554:253-1065(-)